MHTKWTTQSIALPPFQTDPANEAGHYVWAHAMPPADAALHARQLRAMLTTPCEALPPGSPDPEQLYWFRWITGHQISLAAWILAVDVMAQANRGSISMGEAQARCTAWLRLYSFMLIYASSTTVEIYQNLIRPAMMKAHPAFSATWASDYIHLKRNLRNWFQQAAAWPQQHEAKAQLAGVKAAYLESTQIHGKIGKRLIGNAASLLKLARNDSELIEASELDEPETDVGQIYDDFFMAVRSQTSCGQLVHQTITRLIAVVADCRQHGFDLSGPNAMPDFADVCQPCWEQREPIILAALDAMLPWTPATDSTTNANHDDAFATA